MTALRGFDKIEGRTIRSIDSTAINCVIITFTDGTVYEIWAQERQQERHYEIEIISCVKG